VDGGPVLGHGEFDPLALSQSEPVADILGEGELSLAPELGGAHVEFSPEKP
jgi:hypothetical protein